MYCSFLYLCSHSLDVLKQGDAQAAHLAWAQLLGALHYSSQGEMNQEGAGSNIPAPFVGIPVWALAEAGIKHYCPTPHSTALLFPPFPQSLCAFCWQDNGGEGLKPSSTTVFYPQSSSIPSTQWYRDNAVEVCNAYWQRHKRRTRGFLMRGPQGPSNCTQTESVPTQWLQSVLRRLPQTQDF